MIENLLNEPTRIWIIVSAIIVLIAVTFIAAAIKHAFRKGADQKTNRSRLRGECPYCLATVRTPFMVEDGDDDAGVRPSGFNCAFCGHRIMVRERKFYKIQDLMR